MACKNPFVTFGGASGGIVPIPVRLRFSDSYMNRIYTGDIADKSGRQWQD
jgi:hypothetical protein